MTSADQTSADDQKLVAALDEGKCWEQVFLIHVSLLSIFLDFTDKWSVCTANFCCKFVPK